MNHVKPFRVVFVDEVGREFDGCQPEESRGWYFAVDAEGDAICRDLEYHNILSVVHCLNRFMED